MRKRPGDQTRDGNNRFTPNVEDAQLRAEAARLRAKGWTYTRIADELGYSSRSAAANAVKQVLAETAQDAGDEFRKVKHEELRMLTEVVWGILEREHIMVSNGRVVFLSDEPLKDPGPALAAASLLLRLNESGRKLDGADEPARVSVEAQQIGAEIASILDQLSGSRDDSTT
ncbi:helix-turn-helix domain-containing protein [Streptomyces sp. NPDC059835]|uniref:helix-turn-helix domain-containing protein n=1 Tax=Streptomyces sp. NPDC059835 TaxID=3346967 RepID=UPI003646EA42